MAMLLQMVDIVREEKPDVFLLCGDVYHTPQPSASVQTMFTNALVEIHDANPDMTIVITAGNHDSGTKHDCTLSNKSAKIANIVIYSDISFFYYQKFFC